MEQKTEKFCKSCGETKIIADFYRDKSRPDGFTPYCQACVRKVAARPPRIADPPGMKRCQRCKETKPKETFYRKAGTHDGLAKRCSPCELALHDKWRRANMDKAAAAAKRWRANNPDRSADHSIKQNYGLPIGSYDKMLAEQGGLCAICRTDKPGGSGKRFSVDHCHDTGNVRGLLCSKCNIAIAHFAHIKDFFHSISRYLA